MTELLIKKLIKKIRRMKNSEQPSKEELINLKKREYYQNNKEKILARQAEYIKRNPKKQEDANKKYHFTYQTKNIINGKTYIGVHSTNNLNDGYIGSGKALLNSVKKHGKENFKVIIMNFFESSKEAFEEESFLVDDAWVKDRNNYNMSIGGFGGNLGEKINKKRSESIKNRKIKISNETRLKISESARGRKASDETKIKMSASQKGRKHSEETKEKIRQLNLGKIPTQKTINAISKANSGENNIKFKNKTSGLPLYICNHNSKENPFIVRYKGIKVGIYPTLTEATKGKEEFLNNLK